MFNQCKLIELPFTYNAVKIIIVTLRYDIDNHLPLPYSTFHSSLPTDANAGPVVDLLVMYRAFVAEVLQTERLAVQS